MDAAHWPQGIGIVIRAVESTRPVEKKPRPQREEALNCARCNSTHTKFCYYNNYSLSQPRYFCKACRRYWTQGGILRNVPVGGGSRKKQRSSKKVLSENLSPPKISPQNPKIYDGHALNLTYNQPIYNGITEFVALPFALDTQNPNFSSSHSSDLPSMASNSNPVSSSTYSMHEFNPRLSFSLDGLENGSAYFQSTVQNQSTSSRIIFPFEEYVSNCELGLDNKGQPVVDSNGYWNGMLPGGSPIL